jgi:hypothetical protein
VGAKLYIYIYVVLNEITTTSYLALLGVECYK